MSIFHTSRGRAVRLTISLACLVLMHDRADLLAQSSSPVFEHLTVEEGLSSSKVEDVVQDEEGFYWIATQNGLNRFDGTSFRIFRHIESDSQSLTHNHCMGVAKGSAGDIWVATYYGVSRYLKDKGHFQQIYLPHPFKNQEIANRVFNLCVDKEGNAWFSGHGVWKYDIKTDSVSFIQLPPAGKHDSDPGLVAHIEYDSVNHGIWLSSSSNLYFFDLAAQQFYSQSYNPKQWKVFDYSHDTELAIDNRNRLWFLKDQTLACFDIRSNEVILSGKTVISGLRSIHSDSHGKVWLCYWLATSERYDPETQTVDTGLFEMYRPRSILNPRARSVYQDAQKNYWIASGDGISIYNEENQYYKMYRIASEEETEKGQMIITSIAQSRSGYLWVGTTLGLFEYEMRTGNLRSVRFDNKTLYAFSLCLVNDKLWISSEGDVFCLDLRSGRFADTLRLGQQAFIRKGKDNDIWIGCWNRGLYHYYPETKQLVRIKDSGSDSTSLLPAGLISGLVDEDILWVGYNAGAGFTRYESDKQIFRHYQPLQQDTTRVISRTITVIAMSNDSAIWLGTHGNGTFLFNTVTGTYTQYRQEQGLNSNFINGMLLDPERNLWISTADGLNYYNTQQRTISQVEPELVFTENEFVANAIYGVDGKLYFFCRNEIAEIDPLTYHPEQSPARLVISGFKVFDKEYPDVSRNSAINLSYQENFFSFEYSLLRTHPRREVKYAHILEGFESDWNVGTQNFVSYTNVPHGNYRFKVKATNHDGQWSDVLVNIPVHITPPFWRSWWFIVLCILAIAAAIITIYRYRIRQIRRIYMIKAKISQDLHDDVGSSLSSIHIYSSVAERALSSNPEKAKEIVQQIKQNSRQVLESMGDIVWSINTEGYGRESLADRIRNYSTDLLSQKNILCRYKIDAALDKKLLEPESRKNVLLIVKEALNNIAKYSEATEAEVRISMDHPHLQVSVWDNGKGFHPDTVHKGNGLGNMKERAESLGGNLEIRSAPGAGTLVQSRIPLTRI